jgi:hypothetical protein
VATSAYLLPSPPSKRPDGAVRRDTISALNSPCRQRSPYRPHPSTDPDAPKSPFVLGAPAAPLLSERPETSATPLPGPKEPDAFTAESSETEPPLTSEPPPADAAPLTSEPPLADAAPLTSEPNAAGTAAGLDPSVY